jgi:hypothetical protein
MSIFVPAPEEMELPAKVFSDLIDIIFQFANPDVNRIGIESAVNLQTFNQYLLHVKQLHLLVLHKQKPD